MMTSVRTSSAVVFYLLFVVLCLDHRAFVCGAGSNKTAHLNVDASPGLNRKIPGTLFGIFFEEINHAGAGGLWAELVCNRGFESVGLSTPSYIAPWTIIGNDSTIFVSTDLSPCFERNKVALRMDILCDGKEGSNLCPPGGVGVYNPGYWGMNIEKGKSYKIVLYIRSFEAVDLSVSLTSADRLNQLTSKNVRPSRKIAVDNFVKRNNLVGSDFSIAYGYLQGEHLRNAFRWRESIGPLEKRAGHFADVWNYQTDDGLDYIEFHQLAEDSNTVPVWVINNGLVTQKVFPLPAFYPLFRHTPKTAADMFSTNNKFNHATRSANGPKAFVSEYAVSGSDVGYGNLKAAIGEATFLIGLELKGDVVEMASYAPFFVNSNDRMWSPDSIVFNSWQQYGTPSYWMQHFFKESDGSTILNSNVQADSSTSFVASAITWQRSEDDNYYLRIKVVPISSVTGLAGDPVTSSKLELLG